jgi:hypothetical protein
MLLHLQWRQLLLPTLLFYLCLCLQESCQQLQAVLQQLAVQGRFYQPQHVPQKLWHLQEAEPRQPHLHKIWQLAAHQAAMSRLKHEWQCHYICAAMALYQ